MKTPDDFDEISAVEDYIDSRLLSNSIHFLTGEIEEDNISKCAKWIVFENLNPEPRVLTLYINSPGGDLYQAFGLIDIIKRSKYPIIIIGFGCVMSGAFLILCAGSKGRRLIAPNTGIMCHQYSDTPDGKYHDLKAHMEEGNRCNERMMNILMEATGLPRSKIKSLLLKETDVYLTAQEAVDLGIADYIL